MVTDGGGVDGREDFESARSEVRWYFGEVVGEVAGASPVSEATLVTGLTNLQLAASRRLSPLRRDEVARRTATERVLLLHEDRWEILLAEAELRPEVAAATAAVHDRLATAMHAGTDREAIVPFVHLSLDRTTR